MVPTQVLRHVQTLMDLKATLLIVASLQTTIGNNSAEKS